jgi:hypothetical protein
VLLELSTHPSLKPRQITYEPDTTVVVIPAGNYSHGYLDWRGCRCWLRLIAVDEVEEPFKLNLLRRQRPAALALRVKPLAQIVMGLEVEALMQLIPQMTIVLCDKVDFILIFI